MADRIGDPFADAERFLGKLPDAEAVRMVAEAGDVARQLRGFSLSCPIAAEYLATD